MRGQSASINESVAQMLRAEAFDMIAFAKTTLPIIVLVVGALIVLVVVALAVALSLRDRLWPKPERTREPDERRDLADSGAGVLSGAHSGTHFTTDSCIFWAFAGIFWV